MIETISSLDKAIAIAVQAHRGQKDRYGQPYILHPLRVMMRMKSVDEQIVAVLHDVVEKSEWTLEDLRREGFSAAIIDAVDKLTKRHGEEYASHIERTKTSRLSKRIKVADLEDNMDPERIVTPSKQNERRLARLHEAWDELKKKE